ncbi:unnamed protein product [Rhizoctonia solani]|uniref:Uncharacterized protein n=1 Tax=Rhizoctonia solani TaxID=456999 RepID=A0A8H2WJF8_9AGAM|nr:unnamed protein product [Rhizoctonia solani]
MSLPVSEPCSSGPNYSSQFSSVRDSTDRCLLQFSENFLSPTDEITAWYNGQPFTRFRTIQYRKERTGIGHEFILLLLEEEGNTASHCRLERVGDPEHRFQVLCLDGTTTEDYIRAIPLEDPKSSCLINNSDIIIQINFPLVFDLFDVLAVCYAISRHRKAKRYTLQQYNCYFFSWTVILALSRACVHWDISDSIQERIKIIQGGIFRLLEEQGPETFHSIAYVLSNNGYPKASHGDEKKHPIEENIKSRLHSPEFTSSIILGLSEMLWVDRLQATLDITLRDNLENVAHSSAALFGLTCAGPGPDGLSVFDLQPKQDGRLESAVHKLFQEAVVAIFDEMTQAIFQFVKHNSADLVLLKQRVDGKTWRRCLRGGLSSLYDATNDEESSGFYDRAMSRLLNGSDAFWTSSSALLSCGKLAGACLFSLICSSKRAQLKHGPMHNKNKIIVYHKAALRFGSTIGHGILGIPRALSATNSFLSRVALSYALDHGLSYEVFESDVWALQISHIDARHVVGQGVNKILRLLNDKLQKEIRGHEESHLLGDRFEDNIQVAWMFVLWQQFSETMTGVVFGNLKEFVEQMSMDGVLSIVSGEDYKITPPIGVSGARNRNNAATSTKMGVSSEIPEIGAQDPARHFWSYEDIQRIIRERISRLSKRENEFAPFLKHVPLGLSSEACQRQIEDSMEEIWKGCRRLMTRP